MSRVIHISDAAASRIKYLLDQDSSQGKMLRVSVSGGGCSGFQYSFLFDDAVLEEDYIFEHNDIKVIADDTSLSLLDGSTIDFVEDLTSSSFVIQNPNATSRCGCGNSFSV